MQRYDSLWADPLKFKVCLKLIWVFLAKEKSFYFSLFFSVLFSCSQPISQLISKLDWSALSILYLPSPLQFPWYFSGAEDFWRPSLQSSEDSYFRIFSLERIFLPFWTKMEEEKKTPENTWNNSWGLHHITAKLPADQKISTFSWWIGREAHLLHGWKQDIVPPRLWMICL